MRLAIEELSDALSKLDRVGQKGPLRHVSKHLDNATTIEVFLIEILHLFDAASEEVLNVAFKKQEKRDQYLDALLSGKKELLKHLVNRESSANGPLLSKEYLVRLNGIVEVMNETVPGPEASIDRPDFVAATEELIASVSKWEMDEYVKGTLILQLNSTIAISQSERLYDDHALRKRVKELIGDFAYQFSERDKQFETKFQTLKRWAERAFKSSPKAIGFTSDIVTIAGLLPKP